jgi:molecular chaperone GrpE
VTDDATIKFVDRRRWAGEDGETGGTDAPLRKPTYVEELEQRLAEKDRELREVIATYKEAAHEFDAARVRSRRDVAKEVERGKRVILAELLDIVDNLDRAIEAATSGPDAQTLLQGVEMIRTQFLLRLEGFGVTRIAALGEPFDPACHEAVTTIPIAEAAGKDRVVGVIRQGYRIGGDVLRPAVVAVAVEAEPGGDPSAGSPTARM